MVVVGEFVIARQMMSTIELAGVVLMSHIVLKWKEWSGMEKSSSKEGSTIDATKRIISKPLLRWLYDGFGIFTVSFERR